MSTEQSLEQKLIQLSTYVKQQEERFSSELGALRTKLETQAAIGAANESKLQSRIEQLESLVFAGIAGTPSPLEAVIASSAPPTQEMKHQEMESGAMFRTRSDAELPSSFDVSEDEIVQYATQILEQHGSLPIGKMGSLLHRVANNHRLPTILKERFGGLKRFLQQYPDTFALANDHPYNPHVYLLKGANQIASQMRMTFSESIEEEPEAGLLHFPTHSQNSFGSPSHFSPWTNASAPVVDRPLSSKTAIAASTDFQPSAFNVGSDVFNLFPPVQTRPRGFTK